MKSCRNLSSWGSSHRSRVSLKDFFVIQADYSNSSDVVINADMSHLPKTRRPNSVSLNPKIVDDIIEYKWPIRRSLPCKRMSGKIWHDFVKNTFGLMICNDSAIDVLKKIEIKNLKITPVRLEEERLGKISVKELHWVRIPVGCGEMHKTGYFTPLDIYRSIPRSERIGVSFDLDSWSGVELFRPPRVSGFFFVTTRVAEAIKSAKLTGICITRAPELDPLF